MFGDVTITDIKEVFTVFSPRGRYEKIYNRSWFGLSFCIDGQITYTHNGIETVSDKNHAVILPMGETYTLYGDKSGSFPVINFTSAERLCNTIVAVPIQRDSAYIKDFERLRSLSVFDGNRAEMMSVFYHILHNLSVESSVCKTILPAVKYIEENYHNPNISNRYLADLCNISEVYFRKLFKKHYKTTPKHFITDMRIRKAEQLLSGGGLKICAISESCGFSNQYHFSRIFKEKNGLTPSEYMKFNRNLKI